MDAFIHVESKLSNDTLDSVKLVEVAVKCLQIVTNLSQNGSTRHAVTSAEQSLGCLEAAMCIVSARSEPRQKRQGQDMNDVPIHAGNAGNTKTSGDYIESAHNDTLEAKGGDDLSLKLGDLVLVEQNNPSKNKQENKTELEGVVAHLGTVQFAPGDDWVGIRLTESSAGLGKNDGTVKGVKYFDAGGEGEKSGMFVKKINVKKKGNDDPDVAENQFEEKKCEEKMDVPATVQTEEMSSADAVQMKKWRRLLIEGDTTLERSALLLLQSFSSSKPHRDLMMKSDVLMNSMADVIQRQRPSSVASSIQCESLDLLSSFTLHLREADVELTQMFILVVESQTKAIQATRDKKELLASKKLLHSALLGLENLFCPFMNANEKLKTLGIASDLFVFLADSLYKGSKARRSAVMKEDGMLFHQLTSIFVLSMGSQELSDSILSPRLVSSLIRFIMMASGLSSFVCHIPITGSKGEDHWNASLSNCLFYLSISISELSQNHLGISYAEAIVAVGPSPGSFQSCLGHVVAGKVGASSISARKILVKLDSLSVS
jgi:hypothetical protein